MSCDGLGGSLSAPCPPPERSPVPADHDFHQSNAVGHHVHKHAYHRHQFGSRKKLSVDALQNMGRHEEHGTKAHLHPTTGPDKTSSLANQGGGWRQQAVLPPPLLALSQGGNPP